MRGRYKHAPILNMHSHSPIWIVPSLAFPAADTNTHRHDVSYDWHTYTDASTHEFMDDSPNHQHTNTDVYNHSLT